MYAHTDIDRQTYTHMYTLTVIKVFRNNLYPYFALIVSDLFHSIPF